MGVSVSTPERCSRYDGCRTQTSNRVSGRAAQVADPAVPVEGRAQLLQLVEGLEVVGLDDVARGGPLPVTLGEPGLQPQHGRRRGGRVVVADEPEHPLQVLDVLLALLRELVVAVVRLVRQAQPALAEVHDVALGVAVVVVDVRREQAAAAALLEVAEERRQVAYVAQLGGRLEQRPDRRGALGLDRLLVHERVVEVGDLHGVGVITAGRGQLLDDGVHVLLGLVGQLHERPPAGAVGGDVLLVEPASVDVSEEVVLGPDGEVHARAGVVEDAHGREPTGSCQRPTVRTDHGACCQGRVAGSADVRRPTCRA